MLAGLLDKMQRLHYTIIFLAAALLPQLIVTAILIDAPTRAPPTTTPDTDSTIDISQPYQSSSSRPNLHIRKTKSNDIHNISTMLAMASTSHDTTSNNNWKHRIKYLKVKSSLQNQLHHRWNAMEEGRKTLHKYTTEECTLDSETTCHLLWSNDNFREKLQSAVRASSERNAWEFHDFNYTPNDVSVFNHVMMTAVQKKLMCNDIEEVVVGFCEVAWLPLPSSNKIECLPSIVNLVTCPSHRRRGIASKLMDVATRYARTQWLMNSNTLDGGMGLYVHPENESALYLYRRKGFCVEDVNEDGLLYMSMRLRC